jgi:hypothetical protein
MTMPGVLRGIRLAGPRTLFNVAVNTNVLLYDQIAGRSAIVRKISWRNAQGAQVILRIGTGVAGAGAIVELVPEILCPANLAGDIAEVDLPGLATQANQDIVGQIDAISANNFEAEVEVEVIGA